MVSLLGSVIMVWGICLIFGSLDPKGLRALHRGPTDQVNIIRVLHSGFQVQHKGDTTKHRL